MEWVWISASRFLRATRVGKACDATNPGSAETCLADETQCAADAESNITDFCGMTPK